MISTDDNDDFFGSSPMPDVMIDIETMGLRPNAPMISLGAVAFDSRAMMLGERFYENVSLASAVAQGAVVDPDTVMWWMQQSDDARSALRRGPLHINVVLMKFSEWLEQSTVAQKSRRIWCAAQPQASWRRWMLDGVEPAEAACEAQPVLQRNLTLARRLGVQGTPTLLTQHNERLVGVLPAAQLAARL